MECAQVIVAGAGPVGTVAATRLARQGIDVILLEALPTSAKDLRASTWHPPTLEMMAELGIASQKLAASGGKDLMAAVFETLLEL